MLARLPSHLDSRFFHLTWLACVVSLLGGCATTVSSGGDGGSGASGSGASSGTSSEGAGASSGSGGPCEATSTTAPSVAWKRVARTKHEDEAFAVAIDLSGNTFFVGHGGKDMNIGCGPFGPSWDDGDGGFLAKLSPTGDCLFSKGFGASYDAMNGVATDATGAVYATGFTADDLHVDLGCGPMKTRSNLDILAAKFGPTGACVWSKVYATVKGENHGVARGTGVAVDSAGNSYWIASVRDGADICGQAYGGESTAALTKLDADGNCVFTHGFGPNARPNAIAIDDSDNVVIAGIFQTSVDFGGGPILATTPAPYDQAGFVAKFTADGDHVWSRSTGGLTDSITIAVAPSGGVVVGGSYGGTIDFGSDPITTTSLVNGFLAWLDGDGHQLRLQRLGTDDDVAGVSAVAFDCSGNTVTASSEGPKDDHHLQTTFRKLDPTGAVVWQTDLHGVGASALVATGDAITVAGTIWQTGDFGPPLEGHGGRDAVAFRLSP